MHVNDRGGGIAVRQQTPQRPRCRGIPNHLRREGELVRRRVDVVLAKARHLDASLRQARIDRPDRREQRHRMAARPQAQGGFDRHLGLAAIDMGVVENEDDVQGTLRPGKSVGYRSSIDLP
jgi:hypothetical protein